MGRVMSPLIPVWSWVFAALLVSHLFGNWHVSALRVGKLGLHRPVCMGKLFHSFQRNQQLLMATVESSEQSFTVQSVVVDGFFSKAANFADPQTAGKLYEKLGTSAIKIITDDIMFARKRSVTPQSVYSGLQDIVDYAEIGRADRASYQAALLGADMLVAYNVSLAELPLIVAAACATEGMKRVVLAVCVPGAADLGKDAPSTPPEVTHAAAALSGANIVYTMVTYADVAARGEAQQPYRVVRSGQPLPTGPAGSGGKLAAGDLFRVLVEAVDLPKTYGQVYGMGPGTALDAEILVYMKSRGWSERVQVGLLLGDLMEVIERKVEEENRRTAALQKENALGDAASAMSMGKGSSAAVSLAGNRVRSKVEAGSGLPREGEGNKLAGFFV